MDLAVVNCALHVSGDVSGEKQGDGKRVRVCFGAVAERPLRVFEIEEILSDGKWESEKILRCKKILMETLSPRETSIRANPFSKKVLTGNLLEEAIGKVEERLNYIGL
jgi:CO/xanthine dehydrogenase FAD-binding subunit